ncbi:hypothetical protein AAHA92_03819 [Salvia divinorum]|uniref:Uncharacterized protein n=1 Tax=Salvia divinorum TaxID=28513 RepID=A0ABD1I0H6_SALDI
MADQAITDEVRIYKFQWEIACCLIMFIIFGIWIYFSFLVLPPHIYIQQLHVQENSIKPSNPNTSIVMDLKFKRNVALTPPLRYGDLNITLYCASCQSFSILGYCVVPGFIQGGKKTAHREAVVVPRGPSWDDARQKIAQGSTMELRVELTTTSFVATDNCNYCKKSAAVVVVADFLLDGSGQGDPLPPCSQAIPAKLSSLQGGSTKCGWRYRDGSFQIKHFEGHAWKFTGNTSILQAMPCHACAGPLVTLHPVGSLVYYFPQGHSEQGCLSLSSNLPTILY